MRLTSRNFRQVSTSEKAIGGYFELELSEPREAMHQGAHRFQCARTAFLAVLSARAPRRVWLPFFICDSIVDQVQAAGLECCFFPLNSRLGVAEDVAVAGDDILLYVNYFGICNAEVAKVLRRFAPTQVVLDNSQSFYTPAADCLATIYSPRKFFGVPDGGLLFSSLPVASPREIDEGSEARMRHLIKRLGGPPEVGYADYQSAEASLVGAPPRSMSALSARLLSTVDFDAVRQRRRANFALLHAALGDRNELAIDADRIDAPLCYPFLSGDISYKKTLLAHRVFVPTYWPEVARRTGVPAFETRLVNSLHALPCDQRYRQDDMAKIIGLLTA